MITLNKIKCPYCSQTFVVVDNDKQKTKKALYTHIEIEHSEMVNKDYPASRRVFNYVNKKEVGTCVQCKKKETKWDNENERYNRFCSDRCSDLYVKDFKGRMKSKYNVEHLLNDPKKQREMLSNRKISSVYKHSDGKEIEYTGTYELDLLQYLDNVLNVKSDDIMAAPFEFYYIGTDGNKHFYIPDYYIPSLNLIIEVKSSDNKHYRARDYKDEILKDGCIPKDYNFIKVLEKDYSVLNKAFIKYKK